MTLHRYVVLAGSARGFDTLEEARRFALANYPAVVYERTTTRDGQSRLEEIARHDFLFDDARGEWRIMLA